MPQWDFLDFLAEQARRYPAFRLRMRAEVTDLIEEGGRVVGVRARRRPTGRSRCAPSSSSAPTAATRRSARGAGPRGPRDLGAPIDVLWFRLSREPDDPAEPCSAASTPDESSCMLDRGDYWQCGFVIPKGGIDAVRERGLEAFRDDDRAARAVRCATASASCSDWDDVKLLTVAVDRLQRWYRPGLLCIGDAAHAMSPVGGVGINLAIQDAVAAANSLAAPLREAGSTDADLRRVQRRRELPTRVTQRAPGAVQNRVIERVLIGTPSSRRRWRCGCSRRLPLLRRIPARLIGIGVRPEHVGQQERRAEA